MARLDKIDLSKIEGQTFVIGRDGHIYIDDETVSRRHAAIQVRNGKIVLKDLGSKNGTYLVKNKRMVMIEQGEVSLLQTVMIGERIFLVIDLLKIASEFYGGDDDTTQINRPQAGLAKQRALRG